jgi:hypothetical protein
VHHGGFQPFAERQKFIMRARMIGDRKASSVA